MNDRAHAAYGRGVADEVAHEIGEAYPSVAIGVHPYERGVWFSRVEFVPPSTGAVRIWLAVGADDRFVLTAGDTFRWELPFVPEERFDQVRGIVEEIRQLAEYGLMAVRTNRLLGAFSPSFVGSPGVDGYLDEALLGRFASILERRAGWS